MRLGVLIVGCICPLLGYAATLVDASLEKDEAWVGEGVPLVITLRAPGPFSGTASFDLPEIPFTFFINEGSPIVGSETVAGETWLTQRHTFRMHTRREGVVELPAFDVRFAAKNDYVSDPVPRTGKTPALAFNSKRPPGTENLPLIVTLENARLTQTWSPSLDQPISAGDVIERTVTREATDTTAMLFSDLDQSAPSGVRVYALNPNVIDNMERGQARAMRTDVIKYQFTRAGSFSLPDLTFAWWDGERLNQQTLEGATFEIAVAVPVAEEKQRHPLAWFAALLSLLLIKPMVSRIRRILHSEPRIAARAVRHACAAHDAPAAYAATLSWTKLHQSDPTHFSGDLAKEWRLLTQCLFAANSDVWKSTDYLRAFTQFRRTLIRRASPRKIDALPRLNP